jgi:hypothetical protein
VQVGTDGPIDGDSFDLPMHVKANAAHRVAATDRERFGAMDLQKLHCGQIDLFASCFGDVNGFVPCQRRETHNINWPTPCSSFKL